MMNYTYISHFLLLFAVALGICFPAKNAFAQQAPCLFDSLYPTHRLETAEAGIRAGLNKRILELADSHESGDSIRVIPVVIHVIHNGGTENIPAAQIESQIRILNEDFGKQPGTPGNGDGEDTRIRFCLAKKDPQGRCTNGIVRLKTPLTAHKPVDRAALKQLSFWDNTRYLNMYVVKSITGGVGGYSSFPYAPPDEDGIVVRANLFGDIGTAAASGGRTTTHEVGHWFGLYHTFNGGCGQDTCTDGDYVCDTPPVADPNYTCNLNANSCANDSPNLPDQVRNYMDYTPDDCKNKFTKGQKERILATLDTVRTLIWSPANLAATGCDSAYQAPAICPVAADFVTLTPTVCTGNQVYFMDRSLNTAATWQWFCPGGSPTTSTLQNPTIRYDTVGIYPVTLIATNANGSDTFTIDNYIEVTEPGIGTPLPFARNFDDGAYPPDGIAIINPDGGIAWELDSAAAKSAPFSMRINNLINTNYGTRDELELPFLDLTTAHPDSMVRMTFWWAYARSDANYSDELIVQLSKDCGFNYTQILAKSGAALVTGPTQTTPFIPNASQWKKATINLNAHRTERYVKIRLVNVTDGGNNLYIDDLYIGDGGTVTNTGEPETATEPVRFFPNPAHERIQLLSLPDRTTPVHIRVYDALGRILRDYGEYVADPSPMLDLTDLPPGFLFFTVQSAGWAYTARIVRLP